MKKFLLALLCCASATMARAADEPITQIRLQNTWCYGTCPIDEITLNADGVAAYAGYRNAARDGFYRGQIAPARFAELAKWMESQNFFDLRAQIGRGNIDADDTIVSVARGYDDYAVVFRMGGNEKLRAAMVNAFKTASREIVWNKDAIASQSGVKGWIARDLTASDKKTFADRKPPVTSLAAKFFLVTLTSSADPKIRFSTRSDNEGRIQFFAPPGRYDLQIRDTEYFRSNTLDKPMWMAASQTIEIKAGQFAKVPPQMQLHDFNSRAKKP